MHPAADITVLHVIDPVDVVYEAETKGLPEAETWHDRMSERATELCAKAKAQATEHGCDVRTAIETGSPAREILGFIAEHDIEHVIMGSHGRTGVSRFVLGSVAEQTMRQSPVPVTIVR
jgi:nucleotide-binding universal stress UspA family protein